MSIFTMKVYVVQREGGEVLAVKLCHAAARDLAKEQAPARVLKFVADKATATRST